MHGDSFWATRRSGPNAFTYSARIGSSRRSRGTSGKWARSSSTVIDVRADRALASRSRDRRIWTIAASVTRQQARHQGGERLLHFRRRANTAQRAVLVELRDPEDCHDPSSHAVPKATRVADGAGHRTMD